MEQQQYEEVTAPCIDVVLPDLATALAAIAVNLGRATPLPEGAVCDSHATAVVVGIMSQIVKSYERRLAEQPDTLRDLMWGLYTTTQRVTRDNPNFKQAYGVVPDPS